MKILLITDNHTPTGGAEKYFFELKARLKSDPTLEVFSLGFGPKAEKTKDAIVFQQSRSKLTRLFWQCFYHLPTYFKLKRALKQINPDVIHLHNNKQCSLTVLKAIKPYPVVLTAHDFSLICPTAQNIHQDLTPCESGFTYKCASAHQVKFKRPLYWAIVFVFLLLRNKTRKTVDAYLTPSPFLTQYLEKARFTPAITQPLFLHCNQTPTTTADRYTFLFAGNLGEHKGCTLLLREFAIAHQTNRACRLLIAGMGPLENKLKQLARELNIHEHITFLGWQENLTPHYQKAAAIIFPSIGLESFGLVMTDAMSEARPVIGTNRGTCSWLITDQETGLLFDPLVTGDLAQKILYLADHPEKATAMGQAGHEKLKKLIDNEAALTQLLGVYREVIEKHQPQLAAGAAF